MKYILRKICFIFILISPVVNAEVFEDFSGSMSLDKFTSGEINQTVVSGELVLASRASASSRRNARTSQAFLINSAGVTNYSADLKITELSLGNSETQQAEIRLFGEYYFTDVGIAWVSIALGDRGNGLEAWYVIYNDVYDNGQYVSSNTFVQGSLASNGLSLNTSYRASITYDGATGLTFIFNGGTPVTVQGPVKTADSSNWVGLGTRVRFGNNNSTPNDFNDELPEDGSIAFVSGAVDNVVTDVGRPSDDFSTTNLDNWNRLPNSTSIIDGQLELTIAQAGSSRFTQRAVLVQQNLKYFGAKMTLSSQSTPGATARIRARITGYLGNDTFDESNGDISNGFEGNIFNQITLERLSDGRFRFFVYISRSLDADFNTEDEILFQEVTLGAPIAYDVQYDVAIEQVGNRVNYIFDGVTLVSFDLTTSPVFSGNLYDATSVAFSQLNARIQDGPGKVVALFDDIVTQAPMTSATTIDIDGNGEIMALTDGLLILRSLFGFSGDSLINGAIGTGATRSTASDISAYLSQLTSGDMALDIDGSGDIAALTDGLLVLRSLFGFSGDSLISGALGTGATRNTALDVEAYIQQLKGQ